MPRLPLLLVPTLLLLLPACAHHSAPAPSPDSPEATPMPTHHIRGTFDVTLTPQSEADGVGDPGIGRMSIDKAFHGDLEATSKGQMLAVRTDTKGSAGYVAMEKVSGTLNNRAGTFALQHSGSMNRGTPHLDLSVVPDSATGALTGLSGTMKIIIESGQHFYEFDYSLPPAP